MHKDTDLRTSMHMTTYTPVCPQEHMGTCYALRRTDRKHPSKICKSGLGRLNPFAPMVGLGIERL